MASRCGIVAERVADREYFVCQAPESLALIYDDELEWPEGTRVGTKAFVRQALKLAAAAARPEPKMESAAPATGLSLAVLVCGVYIWSFQERPPHRMTL